MTAPFFSAGFRPFFLAAASRAALALALWIAMLNGGIALPTRFDPLSWHIHEMLFGFVMAGVTGFLLTAIPNWTGRPPVAGTPLAVLLALWVLGRIACLVSAWLPPWAAPAIDLALPLALEIIAARELIAAGNRRNFPLLLPPIVLAAGNLLMHLESLGVAVPQGLGWRLGVATALVLISVIGGRIVPAFTRNWLKARGSARLPAASGAIDRIALGTLHLGLMAWAFFPDQAWAGVLLLVGAAANLWRLAQWRGFATAAEPMLAILHLGYLWLVAGAALLGLVLLGAPVPVSAALHALTAGAFGTMLLAVMTRATLGHTGRPLRSDAVTIAAYALVIAGTLLRIVAACPVPIAEDALLAGALCWAAAFLAFAGRYGPMLLSSRVP